MTTMFAILLIVLVAAAVSAIGAHRATERARRSRRMADGRFLLALSGLLAKMAMADGSVSADEVATVEKMFADMGLSQAEHALCVGNFVIVQREGGDAKALARQDVGGDIRFSSIGEIYWCVASLNRYAPFLHKIYLVTDGQDPHLGPYLDKLFPEGSIPIEVVDHSVLFAGYEEYLPVFNSRAIETMLHRIPGLAEHYVLLNDDFLLTAPVQPTDFFTADGKPVLYANRFSTTWARFLYGLKPVRDGRPKATFKRSLLRAVERVGHCPTFFYLTHTPRALTKSFFQEYYTAHPDAIEQNIRHRFRDAAQYNPQELYYLTEARRGAIKRIPNGKKNFYLMPKGDEAYTRRKLERLEHGDYLFCCFNSLEQGSEQERQLIVDWVKSHLALR